MHNATHWGGLNEANRVSADIDEVDKMKQTEVTKEMYFYLGLQIEEILEEFRGAAKRNGATDRQIDIAIKKVESNVKRRAL